MLVDAATKYYHYLFYTGHSFEGHRHEGYELNIVLSGQLELTCGDEVFCLDAGAAVVLDAAFFHRNRVTTREPAELLSIHFDSPESCVTKLFTLSDSDLALVRVLDEVTAPHNHLDGAIAPDAQRIARDLLEALLLRAGASARTPEPAKSRSSDIYRKAVGVMRDSIGRSLSVADIARRCGVCTTHLKMAFAECAGKGVQAYFFDMKMERARELLAAGMRAKAVAAELGFSSPAYFSQCFRRETGGTVREFLQERSR